MEQTIAGALVAQLGAFGVRDAFGVSGGAIAVFFDALLRSPLRLRHFRHESGAVFAATEAYFATNEPVVVFTTTGPGLLNALAGLYAARGEGAKLVLVSGHTNSAHRGRRATQETSAFTMPQDLLYGRGPLFDLAVRLGGSDELLGVAQRLGAGLASPGGFLAHIALPMAVQSQLVHPAATTLRGLPRFVAPGPPSDVVVECAEALRRRTMAIWVGFGARGATEPVRQLVRCTRAPVFCSARAKGIVSGRDPCFLGVTGLGGHPRVLEYMRRRRPESLLVLGTQLGEPTSFWDPDMLPKRRIVHVDLDPRVPGAAYPDFETLGVQSEIGAFVRALLDELGPHESSRGRPQVEQSDDASSDTVVPDPRVEDSRPEGLVRPQAVMDALQHVVVDGSDLTLLSECGNSFAWCNHHLVFDQPHRYRVSTFAGSMGHAATGVVGAALASGRGALAVVGDGAMLMFNEVSTATQYGARAIWVVLNDQGYGMCRDGHEALGLRQEELGFSARIDFVCWARAMGASAERVTAERELRPALTRALAAPGPHLVDVHVDPSQPSPLTARFRSLTQQGQARRAPGHPGGLPGWDR